MVQGQCTKKQWWSLILLSKTCPEKEELKCCWKGNFIEPCTLKILGVSRTNKMLTYFCLWPLSVKWNSSMRHCVSRRETFVPSYFKIHQFIAKWGSRQTQSWPILTFDIEVWLRVLRYKCESSMRHSVSSMLTFVPNKLLIHPVMVKLESGQRKFQANLTFDQKVWPHRLRYQNDFGRDTPCHQSLHACLVILKICRPIMKIGNNLFLSCLNFDL